MATTCKHELAMDQCAVCQPMPFAGVGPSAADGTVGAAVIGQVGSLVDLPGETVSGVVSVASLSTWRVELIGGNEVLLGVTEWANGEREVKPLDFDGEKRLSVLADRRLTIFDHRDGRCVVLQQLRIDPSRSFAKPKVFSATDAQLNEGARLDVGQVLKLYGATRYGVNQRVSGETGRSAGLMAAMFEPSNEAVPIVAWVVTRALPLYHGWTV